MNWFLSVTVINTCFIFTRGQNIHSHVPDFALQSDLPGPLVDSRTELSFHPVQVNADPNLHRHGSVVHSHPETGVHTHPRLPQPSEPLQSDPYLHRHGSVIHSHPYTDVHIHPNLPHPSEPVLNDPYLHRHGSVIHSHPYTEVHTHPNLPHPSQPVYHDQYLHRNGSVVPSHPYTGVHTHPHLPQPSEPVRRIQHAHDPSTADSGSIAHSHVSNSEVLPDLVNQSPQGQVTGGKETHAHGPVVHSHTGGSIPHSHQTLLENAKQENVLQNEPRSGSVSHDHFNQDVHSQKNLRLQSQPVSGSSDTHRHGTIVHTHRGGSNTHSHQTLARNSPQGFDPIGEPVGRRPDIRWLPNYTLAGGQACNTQCKSGIAPRSCTCARFMCYYLGCSSRCSLVQENDHIRATCQSLVDVTNNQAISPSTLSRCDEPLDPGNCASRIYSRFGYSARSGKCVRFNYSGCGGNRNRFNTRNACKRACI